MLQVRWMMVGGVWWVIWFMYLYTYQQGDFEKKKTFVFALRDFTTPVQKLLKEFLKKILYMVNIFLQ